MFKSIFKTATFRQSQVTVLGTVINGLLGALFLVFLARFLGPANFGLFTVSTVTLVLIADIVDFGTNTGLIRFVSKNLTANVDKAYKFLKLSLEIKLTAWFISLVAIFLLAPILATQIFHKEELVIPLRLAGFGIGGALLFTFATSALQAYQKYFTWSLVNIFSNSIRLLLILILGISYNLNIESSLLVYIAMPFFGFFLTLLILPTRKIFQSKNEFGLAKELFQYNIPVALFTILAAFSAKLDTYITAALLSSKEVGVYGAANQFVQFMPQLVSALGLVSSPKFAAFRDNKEMITYFKKFQLLVSGLCILGLAAIPLAFYAIPQILGLEYKDAIMPFVILLLAQLIFLFSIPVHHSVIFYFGRPDVFIWVSLFHLLIIAFLGYFLILNFGMIGAAFTVLIGTTFNFVYPLIWLLVKLKK